MSTKFRIARIVAAAATLLSVGVLTLGRANAEGYPNANAYARPTSYTSTGTPQYGPVGNGPWQVAGIVNLGEPSLRVVYDSSVPGSYNLAMYAVQSFASNSPYAQPGITTDLREIGYTAHYSGVQLQLYGTGTSVVDGRMIQLFSDYGYPLILT